MMFLRATIFVSGIIASVQASAVVKVQSFDDIRKNMWEEKREAIEKYVKEHGMTNDLIRLIAKFAAPKANIIENISLRTGDDFTKQLAFTCEAEECPWVKHQSNELYASVNITGEDSWVPLVRNLAYNGKNDFVVMTGRHGDLVTRMCTKDGRMLMKDAKHTKEDKQKKIKVEREDKKGTINIDIIDTTNIGGRDTTQNHLQALRAEVNGYLKQNKVVILAWCFSLYCHEYGSWENIKRFGEFVAPDAISQLYTRRGQTKIGEVMAQNEDFFKNGNAFEWSHDGTRTKKQLIQEVQRRRLQSPFEKLQEDLKKTGIELH